MSGGDCVWLAVESQSLLADGFVYILPWLSRKGNNIPSHGVENNC